MESRHGDRGSDPVSSRVAQKLANSTVISIPIRTRRGATRPSLYSRKSADALAVADFDEVTRHDGHHPADALSLAGTTPPSSPKVTVFSKSEESHDVPTAKADPSRHHLDPADATKKGSLTADSPFRKHNRGIGSIDSILSSTTCVNTHSECSRPDSRLSHCPADDDDKCEAGSIEQERTSLYVSSRDLMSHALPRDLLTTIDSTPSRPPLPRLGALSSLLSSATRMRMERVMKRR